jgi:hypothetical protein
VPQGGGKPGGVYDFASKQWQREQREAIQSLLAEDQLRALGCTKARFQAEAQDIVDRYFETFHSSANPWRKFWRSFSLRGSALRAGFLSHEWRTLVWNSLKHYHGKCFKIAMVARYDSESGQFVRHWISVTFGKEPAAWGDRTALLDPWLEGTSRIFRSSAHEKGNWMGTSYDPEIGPGGVFLDEAGRAVGGEIGPLE